MTGDWESGRDIRRLCRTGALVEPTSGRAPGYVQCNVVMMPADSAHYFRQFCEHNPRPCPLLAMSEAPGSVALAALGTDIDIRTDLPQYRIWRDGVLTERCEDVEHLWEDDWVAFALGCSFSFSAAASMVPLHWPLKQRPEPTEPNTRSDNSRGGAKR